MNNPEKLISELVDLNNFALGNDLVFIPDFKKSFNDLFKKKVYTDSEIAYCEQFDQSLLRYASTWAAKEAVYKAVKQLIPGALPFKSIVISRAKAAGIPSVSLPAHYDGLDISLSISHDGDYVWAIAIIKSI